MRTIKTILILAAMILIASCSGSSGNPVEPQNNGEAVVSPLIQLNTGHYVWGFWNISISDDQTAEAIPVRTADMHFNTVRLLEVTPCADCLQISNINVISPNEWTVDLTLKHPYPGNLNLTGFDVRGIFITGADYTFPVSNRSIAWGNNLPRLLNTDGYTALFNPTDFSETNPPCLGYIQGKHASGGDLSATLNPFIAYGKANERRMFPAGAPETRTVHLQIPGFPFEFGYAVDACWHPVDGDVTDPVTDFPPEANCNEAYELRVQVGAGLGTEAGSETPIEVEVFDHQGLDTVGGVFMEAPDLFSGEVELSFEEVTANNGALYKGTIINEFGTPEGEYPLLVGVMDTETDPYLGDVNAWHVYPIGVGIKKGWAVTWGGIIATLAGGIVVDNSENIYITGCFGDTVDFDPGFGVEEQTSNGVLDAFLSKFDLDGNFQWVRTWGSVYDTYGNKVIVDDSGNPYITGRFQGTADFDPGSGTDNHSSNGDYDIFLSKFDSNGIFQWAHTWGGGKWDEGYKVVLDDSGNPYTVGFFTATVDFDPSDGIDTHNSNGGEDAFFSKFDSNGNFQWAKTWGGTGSDSCRGLVVDDFGYMYITGNFHDIVDFNPDSGVEEYTSNGDYDIFLSKFDLDGNFQWVRTWGGTGMFDTGCAIIVNNNGYVYVTGYFDGMVDFDPGSGTDMHTSNGSADIFLSKFDLDGNFQWVRTWGGTGFRDSGTDVKIDYYGNIFITGFFNNTVDFDPGPGVDEHTSINKADAFLSKFDSNGIFQWVRVWGGIDWYDVGSDIGLDNDGDIYVTGYFGYTVDFDPGPGVDEHTSNGIYQNAFLSKFPSDGNW